MEYLLIIIATIFGLVSIAFIIMALRTKLPPPDRKFSNKIKRF
jgi:hypothetical protein